MEPGDGAPGRRRADVRETRATITARTLVEEDAAADAARAEAIASLPRITIERREAAPVPSASARSDDTLVTTIGEGGMGRVHLARQRRSSATSRSRR